MEREKKVLEGLLSSGGISKDTYIKVNGRLKEFASRIEAAKSILEEERTLQLSTLNEQINMIESLLVDLTFRYLTGEITEVEWREKSRILTLGLDSTKDMKTRMETGIRREPAPPKPLFKKREEEDTRIPLKETEEVKVKTTPKVESKPRQDALGVSVEKPLREVAEGELDGVKRYVMERSIRKGRTRPVKAPSELDDSDIPVIRCRNPWNKECRNTDIVLSIYYNGELLPICRECWEKISEKNIEWSSC
ncbi:hypothetical protein DRO55_00500 [Candidatus Bathyarchaeota archaeon]|nr:MAG: hypothetical protein DRO55_00500 [Candidatus Bathyarchaeota archaeon]